MYTLIDSMKRGQYKNLNSNKCVGGRVQMEAVQFAYFVLVGVFHECTYSY